MKYKIWNKKDEVYTPNGKVFSAEQWMAQYPIARKDNITILCAAGEINGAFFGTLNALVERYEDRGVDFSDCKTSEEKLAKIEQYEKEQDELAKKEAEEAANKVTAEDRIAAALEYNNILNSPVINDDDPDLDDLDDLDEE